MNNIYQSRAVKAILLVLIIFMLLPLQGCINFSKEEKKPEVIKYTKEELEKNASEGIFVMYSEDSFAPILKNLPGYTAPSDTPGDEDDSDDRFIWFVDQDDFVTKSLPVASPTRPLIARYNSDGSLPEEIVIEKFDDIGYTVGTNFVLGNDDTPYVMLNNMLSGSNAETVINSVSTSSDDQALLKSFKEFGAKEGEGDDIPYDNFDTDINIITNLNDGGDFVMKAYSGTQLKTYNLIADTHVFKFDKDTAIYRNSLQPYKKTSKGYFQIKFPITLGPGYYYINGLGMFKYEK